MARQIAIGVGIYLVVTAIFYFASGWYIRSIGDLGAVPKVVWILFGPAIALGSGHGLAAYLAASVIVVPLVVFSLILKDSSWRRLCLAGAVAFWIGIGWFLI